jgi:hypothetical protein
VIEIDVDSLGHLSLLGEGGEAEVLACGARPGTVLKRFRPAVRREIFEAGLIETVGLLAELAGEELTHISTRAMWPHTIVKDHGSFVGYLMPALPDYVWCRHGRHDGMRRGLADWNKLSMRHTWMNHPVVGSTLPPIGESDADHEKLSRLLRDLAKSFDFLHRHMIVLGDVSGRNMLWTLEGNEPRTILIDCDGYRREGRRAVTAPKQTPDWVDDATTEETSVRSDLYKLGLAIYRAYYSDGLGYPAKPSPNANVSRYEVLQMAKRIDLVNDRPTAAEWLDLLGPLSGERPRRKWKRPPRQSAPTQATEPLESRPKIPFRKRP